jgi:DNA-binding CsgD family transcriptional regulator
MVEMTWLAATLLERAEGAEGFGPWRLAVLDLLRAHVHWDDAFWGMSPASDDHDGQVYSCANPTSRIWARFFEAPEEYRLPLAMQRTWQAGGVGIDTELLNQSQLDHAPLYSEILRPVGVRTTMTLIPSFRKTPTSCIGFSRHGATARFRPKERAFMLEAVTAIGVVEMAFGARRARVNEEGRENRLTRLSPRERQVATWVAQGFSNKEVANLLGTSIHTVRKQTVSIYAKLRTNGRAQLAHLLAGHEIQRSK